MRLCWTGCTLSLLLLCCGFIFIICLILLVMRLDFEVGLHREWRRALFFKGPPTHVCLSLLGCDSLAYRRQRSRGHPQFSCRSAAWGKDLPPRSGFVTQFSEWNMSTFFAADPCRLMRGGLREREWKIQRERARGLSSSLSSEVIELNILQILPRQFCGWHCRAAGRDYWIITQYKETCSKC